MSSLMLGETMIARTWRGAVRLEDGDAYAAYMQETGVATYATTPGNRGVWMLRRDVDDRTEFVMFTLWESLDAVKAFAGENFETAVFYPEDERFLIERDLHADHFEVETHERRKLGAVLRGERIALRPLQLDDVVRVVEIQSEPGVARWWGLPDEANLRRQAEGRTDHTAFAIECEGELIGLIQFYEEDEPDYRAAAIDLFLTGSQQGQGLGTDAVRTLARYLIEERRHHRLTIDPAADNTPAIRSYEKVGFRPVGVMREHWRSLDGTWKDGLLMELLARELVPTASITERPRG
jgi:aminoglycoside 6'-N-acetyltransferase